MASEWDFLLQRNYVLHAEQICSIPTGEIGIKPEECCPRLGFGSRAETRKAREDPAPSKRTIAYAAWTNRSSRESVPSS